MLCRFYVYQHLKPDGTVFYVGVGTKRKNKSGKYKKHTSEYRRAYEKHNRSKYWNAINAKYEIQIQIVKEFENYEDAKVLEQDLILKHGRKDLNQGSLVNFTNGGDGCLKRTVSELSRTNTKRRWRELVMPNSRNFRTHLVINVETGIFYDGIREAYNSFNATIAESSFRNHLFNRNPNKTKFKLTDV